MTARLFRLTEMHQRIDDRLRALRGGSPEFSPELALQFALALRMKHRVKVLIARALQRLSPQPRLA